MLDNLPRFLNGLDNLIQPNWILILRMSGPESLDCVIIGLQDNECQILNAYAVTNRILRIKDVRSCIAKHNYIIETIYV